MSTEIGTVGTVKQLIKLSKKVCKGSRISRKNRAVLKKIEETDPYLRAEVRSPGRTGDHDSG